MSVFVKMKYRSSDAPTWSWVLTSVRMLSVFAQCVDKCQSVAFVLLVDKCQSVAFVLCVDNCQSNV